MLTLLLIGVVIVILILNWYLHEKVYFLEKRNVTVVKVPNKYNFFWMFLDRVVFTDLVLNWYNLGKDKSIFGFYSVTYPLLIVKNPDILRQIMIKDFDHFTDHSDTLFKEENDPLFGKNLFALKGKRWHAMRTILSPAFTGSKMRNMFELIDECGEQLVKYFDDQFEQMNNGDKVLEIEFQDMCTRFTNDVIATVALGIKVDSLKNPNNQFYKIGQYVLKFPLWRAFLVFCFPRFTNFFNIKILPNWMFEFFQNTILETMRIREEQKIIRPDMIHILTEARRGLLKHDINVDKNEGFAVVDETEVAKTDAVKSNIVLTDEDIIAQAFVFFTAGFGNVALTMCWAAYELALNPDIQTKLYNEIKHTLEETNGKLTYNGLMKMKYLDLVVTETLRKWPPLQMTDRIVTKPYTLKTEDGDVDLDVGQYVGIPVMGLHRDPKYYPNPEKFDPERFSDPEKIHPFTYLPFGNGPRICIGSRLALLKVKVFLANMLPKFEFRVTKKTPIPLALKTGTSLEPVEGFWLGLKCRK